MSFVQRVAYIYWAADFVNGGGRCSFHSVRSELVVFIAVSLSIGFVSFLFDGQRLQ